MPIQPTSFGADGTGSSVRGALMKQPRFNFTAKSLSTVDTKKSTFLQARMASSTQYRCAAHLAAPRIHAHGTGQYRQRFTGTVFAPFTGEYGLDQLKTGADGMRYFEKYFKDAIPLIPI